LTSKGRARLFAIAVSVVVVIELSITALALTAQRHGGVYPSTWAILMKPSASTKEIEEMSTGLETTPGVRMILSTVVPPGEASLLSCLAPVCSQGFPEVFIVSVIGVRERPEVAHRYGRLPGVLSVQAVPGAP
jgi:hypothetical protein